MNFKKLTLITLTMLGITQITPIQTSDNLPFIATYSIVAFLAFNYSLSLLERDGHLRTTKQELTHSISHISTLAPIFAIADPSLSPLTKTLLIAAGLGGLAHIMQTHKQRRADNIRRDIVPAPPANHLAAEIDTP